MTQHFGANERWWWPSCPQHGRAYITNSQHWVYCKDHGWHQPRAVDNSYRGKHRG